MNSSPIFGRQVPLTIHTKALIVTLCALAYFGTFQLNQILFSDFLFTHRVHWVYLPSGMRLLLVLLFFELGAAGIFLGSMAINYYFFNASDPVFVVVLSLLSAGVPLIVRSAAIKWFGLNVNLKGLTTQMILKMSIALSLLSAFTIQAWFYWNGKTVNFLEAFTVMAVGKFFGTALVLTAFSFLMNGWRAFIPSKG